MLVTTDPGDIDPVALRLQPLHAYVPFNTRSNWSVVKLLLSVNVTNG
jgi:hypothetical protein